MKASKLDNTIMLLSTDWFLPYWATIGVGLDEERESLLQRGCREIVKQILSGAREYWLADFSDQRLQRTHSSLQGLVRECQLDERANKRIAAIIGDEESSHIDDGTGWLLVAITEQLLNDSLAEGQELSPTIKKVLAKAWNKWKQSDLTGISFENLSLSSESVWDNYMRNLTPDLPTYLADYLRSIRTGSKSEMLWTVMTADLTKGQRQELVLWYRRLGRSMTGDELALPLQI